jgi:DNA polymerase III delta prime subunit
MREVSHTLQFNLGNGTRSIQMAAASTPWVEKYRPQNLSDVVLEPHNKVLFDSVLERARFPNLLFYGPPGTGKTTTIINLVREYHDRYNSGGNKLVMHLNASDDRGIEVMRTRILQFVSTEPVFGDGLKFVVLDEVDSMTTNAQVALRHIINEHSATVRFCLICNFISRIDTALQKVLVLVRFKNVPRDQTHVFLRAIVDAENTGMADSAISVIIDAYDSDMRSMVNAIQLSSESAKPLTAITDSDADTLYTAVLDASVDASRLGRLLRTMADNKNCHARDIISHMLDWLVRERAQHIWVDASILAGFVRAANPSTQESPYYPLSTMLWLRHIHL